LYYFPENYTWSLAFHLALMAGAQFGEMDRWLAPMKESEPNAELWGKTWSEMAQQQEDEAAHDLKERIPAECRCPLSSSHSIPFQRRKADTAGAGKSASYQAAGASFAKAIELMPLPFEHVEVNSPDGILPGYIIQAATEKPAPVVIFYSGFDVVKEMLYCFIHEEFAHRGISCLVIDTSGVGEPLRLRNVPSRPDYEVPVRAIVDHLETRADIDSSRIGILGISLGGYYAPRSAAFEPRIKPCVAWGAIWGYGAVWQKRWAARSKGICVPFFQFLWVMGTKTMEEALERGKQWTLSDVLPHLKQPLLILHGENDLAIPVEDIRKAYAAAGSTEKRLRIFTVAQGGAEHVQADQPDQAKQLIADWFAQRLNQTAAKNAQKNLPE
jgi:dienelactone hydrolase